VSWIGTSLWLSGTLFAAGPAPQPTDIATDSSAPTQGAPTARPDGRRLLVASAVLGGVGLAMNTSRAIFFSIGCKNAGYHYDSGCFGTPIHQAYGTVFFGGPAAAANLTGIALGTVGAWRRGLAGPRKADGHLAWGGIMLGLGVATQIACGLLVLSVHRVDSDEVYDGDVDGDRVRLRYTGAALGAQAGATLSAVGSGLLSHGLAQRKRSVQLGFSPMGLTLRF